MRIELLKLLTAQAAQYELGDSAWNRLTRADISHVLGLMAVRGDGEKLHCNSHTQAAVWLGEVMYLDNRNDLLSLKDHVGQTVIRRTQHKNYPRFKNYARLWTVVRYAINAFVDPKLCPACHGAKRIPLDGVIGWARCEVCGETGLRPGPSGEQIAIALDIDSSRWSRTWGPIYEECDWKIKRLHDSLVAVFAARLGHAQGKSVNAQEDQYWPYAKTPKNKALDTTSG